MTQSNLVDVSAKSNDQTADNTKDVNQSVSLDFPANSNNKATDDTKRGTNHKPPHVKSLKETNYNKKSIKTSDPEPPVTQSTT